MNSDNKLKEIGINISTICYFHDIVNINEFDFGNILLYEKSYKNFLICDIAYQALYGAKLLRIIFDKVESYTSSYDSTEYLALFCSNVKFEINTDVIRYLIILKNNTLDFYSHKYTKMNNN